MLKYNGFVQYNSQTPPSPNVTHNKIVLFSITECLKRKKAIILCYFNPPGFLFLPKSLALETGVTGGVLADDPGLSRREGPVFPKLRPASTVRKLEPPPSGCSTPQWSPGVTAGYGVWGWARLTTGGCQSNHLRS